MEFNRGKIIFFTIVGVIALLLLAMMLMFNNSTKKQVSTSSKSSKAAFSIWMVAENPINMSELKTDFQKKYPQYKGKKMTIETFSDYDTYYYALASAFASQKAPDVFTLNNNETSVFSDNVLGISPDVLKPVDFRKKFKPIFSNDLILTLEGKNKNDSIEFLAGVPVGYETLGVFYDKRYIRSNDLSTIAQMNSKISKMKKSNSAIVPLATGNGTTVNYAPDIVSQFMLLGEGEEDEFLRINTNVIEKAISSYVNYGEGGDNKYNDYYSELALNNLTGAYMIGNNRAAMVIGYPKLLEEIEKKLSSRDKRRFKNFLAVEPFPYYTPGIGKTLVNYDYFVMNKNAANRQIAESFLLYLASDEGAAKYLTLDTYKLPALQSLEFNLDSKKIHEDYNIYLSNFLLENGNLSSFDKGIKNIYDQEMINILDKGQNFSKVFSTFKSRLGCIKNKVIDFKGLSTSCLK